MLAPLLTALLFIRTSDAVETYRLLRGDRKVVALPAAGAHVETDCRRSVAPIYLGQDGDTVEIEAAGSGSCKLEINGIDFLIEVYERGEADQRICDEARARFRPEGLEVRCMEGFVWIGGFTSDALVRAAAEEFGRLHDGVLVELTPPPKEQVEVNVVFLEMRKEKSHDIGVEWPQAIGDLVGSGLSTVEAGGQISLGILNPVTPYVTLEQVVANFEVLESRDGVVALGERLELTDGETIWKEVSGVETATVQEIAFGFHAVLKPEASALGYALELDVSVSEEAPGSSSNEIRTIERGVSSTLTLAEGETLVVGTQFSNRSWRRSTGIPWLQRIPFLGALFGRQERHQAPVKGAVLITLARPGEHPEWIETLKELESSLGVRW